MKWSKVETIARTYFDSNPSPCPLLELVYVVASGTEDESHEVVLRVFLLRNLYPLLQQTILVLHAGRRVVGWVQHFELGDCRVPLVLKLDPLALNSEDIMKVDWLSSKKFKPGVNPHSLTVVDRFGGGGAISRVERDAKSGGAHLCSDLPDLQVQQVDLLRLLIPHPLHVHNGRHPRGNVLLAFVVASCVPSGGMHEIFLGRRSTFPFEHSLTWISSWLPSLLFS